MANSTLKGRLKPWQLLVILLNIIAKTRGEALKPRQSHTNVTGPRFKNPVKAMRALTRLMGGRCAHIVLVAVADCCCYMLQSLVLQPGIAMSTERPGPRVSHQVIRRAIANIQNQIDLEREDAKTGSG